MISRQRLMVAALAGALLLLAPACAPPTADEGDTGGAVVRLVLPHPTNFTVGLPYYVARDQGFFQKQGITVTPTFTSGGGSNVQAVIAGSADIGVETGPTAVFSADRHGAGLKIIAATTTGLDVLLFSKSDGPVKTLRDLSGQKVGYSEPGSSSNVAIDQVNAILRNDGLPPANGQAIGSPPAQLTAVQTGQIGAGWTAPPSFLDQVNAGKLRLLTHGSADYPEYKNVAVRVAFAHAAYLRDNPNQVRGFLTAWRDAWEWIFGHQDQVVELWKRDAGLNDSLATLKLAFPYYSTATQRVAPLDGMDQDMRDAVASGALDAPLTADQLAETVDTRYAPRTSG
jgi:NitT/TauT family transport system substrate-binding protein